MNSKNRAKEFFCKDCFRDFDQDEIVILLEKENITVCQFCANKYLDKNKRLQLVKRHCD